MEIRTLKSFIEIVHTGTISKAAKKLDLSQPALTKQLQQLESELNTQLIDRSHSPLTLTPAGNYLAKQAEKILSLTQHTMTNLTTSEQMAGTITIGVPTTQNLTLILEAIHRTQDRYPDIHFTLVNGGADDLRYQLNEGALDFLFMLNPTRNVRYDSLTLPTSDEWGVILNVKHPLANQLAVSPAEIKEAPLAIPAQVDLQDQLSLWLNQPLDFCQTPITYHNQQDLIPYPLLNRQAVLLGVKPLALPTGLVWRPLMPAVMSTTALVWRKQDLPQPIQHIFLTTLTELTDQTTKKEQAD